jgi:hypothetical protein
MNFLEIFFFSRIPLTGLEDVYKQTKIEGQKSRDTVPLREKNSVSEGPVLNVETQKSISKKNMHIIRKSFSKIVLHKIFFQLPELPPPPIPV